MGSRMIDFLAPFYETHRMMAAGVDDILDPHFRSHSKNIMRPHIIGAEALLERVVGSH